MICIMPPNLLYLDNERLSPHFSIIDRITKYNPTSALYSKLTFVSLENLATADLDIQTGLIGRSKILAHPR